MSGNTAKRYFVGLISGTSVDGIDAGVFVFDDAKITLLAHHSHDYSDHTRAEILQLSMPGANEIDRMGELDARLGAHFAEAALAAIEKAGLRAKHIEAIGSHGQTIRHRPHYTSPFTLQIADPNIIAETTGITCIADVRRRDMAVGGQGAPLAPAFHHAAFTSEHEKRCVVNIGGIANISVLDMEPSEVLGYDTGPGNMLMDAWIGRSLERAYDHNGVWASGGCVDTGLLDAFMQHPYLNLPYPKSTGREDFNLGWLEKIVAECGDLSAQNVQATLMDFSAQTVAAACIKHRAESVYICGGGANNLALMQRLQGLLPSIPLDSTTALGIHHDWVEAGLLAWIAKQTLDGLYGNLPSVTGARKSVKLGAIYPA